MNKTTEMKAFFQDGARLFDTIFDTETGVIEYAWYDQMTGETGKSSFFQDNEVIYLPPKDNLAKSGVMLFPSMIQEYKSTASLLVSVKDFINAYLELPDDQLLIVSLYVLMTWIFDCYDTIPYLRARGEYGSGKTRYLKVIGSICYRPLFAGGAVTTSPIFRLIDVFGGLTLILDEADFRYSGPDSEIIKILNTGYMKGFPVLRTEGDKVRTPTPFTTYGPKILATRKEFEDLALESRCFTAYMNGFSGNRKDIPITLPKRFYYQAEMMRNELLMFRMRNYGEKEIDPSLVIENIEPRINQVLLPLLSLTEGEVMQNELREFALKYAQVQTDKRGETLEAEVLYNLFELSKVSPFISVKALSSEVNKNRTREQGEYLISSSKIGRINKVSYGFPTRQVKGMTELMFSRQIAKKLSERYNVPLPEVDHVDLVDLMEGYSNENKPQNSEGK